MPPIRRRLLLKLTAATRRARAAGLPVARRRGPGGAARLHDRHQPVGHGVAAAGHPQRQQHPAQPALHRAAPRRHRLAGGTGLSQEPAAHPVGAAAAGAARQPARCGRARAGGRAGRVPSVVRAAGHRRAGCACRRRRDLHPGPAQLRPLPRLPLSRRWQRAGPAQGPDAAAPGVHRRPAGHRRAHLLAGARCHADAGALRRLLDAGGAALERPPGAGRVRPDERAARPAAAGQHRAQRRRRRGPGDLAGLCARRHRGDPPGGCRHADLRRRQRVELGHVHGHAQPRLPAARANSWCTRCTCTWMRPATAMRSTTTASGARASAPASAAGRSTPTPARSGWRWPASGRASTS